MAFYFAMKKLISFGVKVLIKGVPLRVSLPA